MCCMGQASASFRFYIWDVDPLVLAEELLRGLYSRFLQPKSMEIRLPGRRLEKFDGSIDGKLIWGKDALPERLPGEKLIKDTDFTTLENPAEGLSIPRDLPQIVERLRAYSGESAELWKTKQALDDDVFWTFWGLCRIRQISADGRPKEGHVLRQQLSQAQCLEPILRVLCHLTYHPRPYLMVSLLIHSFVWSRYTSTFDTASQEWVVKSESQPEFENAGRLAETISEYIRRFPDAEIEWEIEKEHAPNLTGFLPSEFEARLGLPNSPKRVKTLATK